ncbi:LuxR family transcriptional regulator [Haloactinopolyspora alba]|uniref:LuxR family transcriptional regulator n=1 Tax=Haloactinopolyspora alba TaxID=648780 RepID=A0A2P8E1D5_9ACTN|nr:LuxR family transcriptional regulator [Haloactinopolyspora alba]PSL03276.1 LuxR family transcriptional regulator [Haloactinopolyspora alba]
MVQLPPAIDVRDPPAVSTPEFVGRDRQVASLVDALSRPPALVLVEGEAGIGKSRLLQESLAAASPLRPNALVSVCPPLRDSFTLGPIVDAFRGTSPRVPDLALTELAGALRPLFPEWSADLPPAPESPGDAKAARHRLFRALDELIRALGVDLLVVEDAHWADEVTLEFLLFLTSRQQTGGPNLVVTYRPEEVGDRSLLLRLSSRIPAGVTQLRLSLAPLDRAGTATLVSSMLAGEPMSAEFAAFLHERTDGIPLAVEESVRLLCDRADLVFRAGQWVRLSLSELQVPPTVRDSTRERVGRLSPAAQRVLRAAAALAEPSGEDTLAATAGLETPVCRDGVTEAAAAGMLDGDDRGRWRFRHMLAATAVHEAMPPADRREMHLRAGRALAEFDPPPVAQLARHFREAGVATLWASYAEQGAQRAMASGDHTAAVVLLHDLLSAAELPAPDRTRIARAAALAALGRREPVDELHHHLVRTLRDVLDSGGLTDRQQAEIRNPLGRLLINGGEAEAALNELEQAVAHLDHDPVEAARAMTYLGWAYAGPWPASTHLRWLRRAAELTPGISSAADRLSLAGNRAAALLMLGEEEAWDVVAEIPDSGATPAERLDLARINANIGTGALVWGRYAQAHRHLEAAMTFAETEQAERLRYNILLEQANLDWFTGRWDELAQRAEALTESNSDRLSLYLAGVRLAARLSAAAGRRREAEERFQLVLDEAARLGAADDTVEAAAALARIRLADGQIDRALRITDEPMRTVQAKGVWVWASEIAPARVEAQVAAGRAEQAARLTDRFARGLRGRTAPGPRAALAVCRALLAVADGDHARAGTGFARAARAWDTLPRPYDAMLARERRAEALLAAGRGRQGRELLAQVYEHLFRLGARGDADRVAQRLREHDAVVPRLWRGGRHGYGDRLSPRELEVARLVVAGKTNREIGRILAKSPATVDQQLRSAMRKLGVSSRTALAVTAVESGVFSADE